MWGFVNDFYVTGSLAVYGEYSSSEVDLYRQLLRPHSNVVEIGANIGAHTVPIARMCPEGSVIAIEPQQRAFQLLCANLVMNGCKNVQALPIALGERSGWAEVPKVDYATEKNVGAVTLIEAQPGPVANETQLAPMYSLDSLPIRACDFLKLDVEGWEAGVLRGGLNVIQRFWPVMYVENDRGSKQAELIALIDEIGYTMYWHINRLFSPGNFNRRPDDIFNGSCGINMLCVPKARPFPVTGFEPIDPSNWRCPIIPLP
jgi:FkbM family methyltransferase